MQNHIGDSDWQGGVITERSHPQGIADKDSIRARSIRKTTLWRIVCSDYYQREVTFTRFKLRNSESIRESHNIVIVSPRK
jgi:hypothetical protein